MSYGHPYTFDLQLTPFLPPAMPLSLDSTPPYTPRSKSLDLLRADSASATPIAARASLDTLSTLKGHRISSPIFVNSSIGVKPLPAEPSSPNAIEEEEEGEENHIEAAGVRCSAERLMPNASGRALTMPRLYLAGDVAPKTPSRRQKSDHLLRSKFSMSPVQVSKRSKARTSQDHGRMPEGVMSQDTARSTLGNWSHSLGMAARKLQKSTLPRKASDESYKSLATLDVHPETNEKAVTPDKGKNSLRNATSLASIRWFITPSRRVRKVSVTSRGLTGGRGRAMPTVDDVVAEQGTSGSEDAGAWVDADGRTSRDGLTAHLKTDANENGETSIRDSYLTVPSAIPRSTRKALEVPESESFAVRRRAPLSPEFYEPPPPTIQHKSLSSELKTSDTIGDRGTPAPPIPSISGQVQEQSLAQDVVSPPCESVSVPAPNSKLKTLQLLARRPFNAFGKKMRETHKCWFPSRTAPDLPAPPPESTLQNQGYLAREARTIRRSEDLLSKASPRICDPIAAQKSRSVELDRIGLPSKVVPLRPTAAAAGYRRRPTIPDAFAKSVPPPPPKAEARQTQTASPRISDLRHPWMRQLHLASAPHSMDGGSKLVSRQIWPKMNDAAPVSVVGNVPTVSLTAASLCLSQPALSAPVPKKHSPRRPPASLLGQSLPIPPRCGRSRASTISSQSSTTSSPSGKVIVSRRSYGQRLRSPSTREETASIRSVGTSILFTESPPGSPGMRRFMSPYNYSRSPSANRIRSPPKNVLLPKYSPRRGGKLPALHRKPSSVFTDDSETEWIDEGANPGSITALNDLAALRVRLEEVLPPGRPGFLEMSEATQTLSNLVKTFSGSSGSLSLHSSPYKKDTPTQNATPRGLYGIMEADEPSLISAQSRSAAPSHLTSPRARERLISKVSIVSTEANSSFEDSEELQRLLDSIMAADLGGSCDTSGSRDMALLSPFGSPAQYRDSRTVDKSVSPETELRKKTEILMPMPPPPKFLLNDRPISPPDSSCMSCATHSEEADATATQGYNGASTARWDAGVEEHAPAAACTQTSRLGSWGRTERSAHMHDDAGYASFPILKSYHDQ